MQIYIDRKKSETVEKLKNQTQSLATLETRPFDISLDKLVATDLNNVYAELTDEYKINFYLRSPQQINFICKEIAKDFGSFGINLRIGLNELLMNSLEHGNFQIDKETKNTMISTGSYYELLERLIKDNSSKFIELQYNTQHPKNITIIDQGKGFEFENYVNKQDIADTQYCGRGIFIASQELPKNDASFSYHNDGKKLIIAFDKK